MSEESVVTKVRGMLPFLGEDSRAASAMAMMALASTTWGEVKPWATAASNFISHTVMVSEKDDFFEDVIDWVLDHLTHKAVKKTTVRFGSGTETVVRPMVPGKGSIKFKINGHLIRAVIREPEQSAQQTNKPPAPATILFRSFTKAGYVALIEKLRELYAKQRLVKYAPKLFTPTSWGGFRSRAVPVRTMDSVILKANEIDDLIDDLQKFLDSEKRYNELGVPWHRGYLLYGIAGTGKTSIAKALSAHFGLNIYQLSLGDLDGDNTLNDYVENIKPRSVLLLEDVDVFSAATSREAEDHSASLSGLLNVLDGIATPHGLIKILTTNHIEALDEALIRPGRIDVKKEFTALDQDQGERLFEHFYGKRTNQVNFSGLLPSAVTSTFVQHLDSPQNAIKALNELRGMYEDEEKIA